jgi:hypothetical protein
MSQLNFLSAAGAARSTAAGTALALVLGVSGCSSAPTDATATQAAQTPLGVAWPSKSTRIAVVGAGPSGLTAADTLRQLGYQKVTVFEKNDHVGGKVYSRPNGDGTFTELGAVFASPDYTLVLGLANRYGIPYTTLTGAQAILDTNGQVEAPQAFLTSHYSTLELLAAVAAYTPLTAEMDTILAEDGFAIVPPLTSNSDYYLPFDQFAAKRGITPIAELVRSIMIGFGYGYYETTPAIYYLKLLGWLLKLNASVTQPLQNATYYTFPTGYQSIWTAVAEGLTVSLNSAVTSIVRPSPSGAPVQITINGAETYDFDDVIISAPLNRVSSFMALTSDEEALFSQVQTERYDVSIFSATGLTPNETLFFYPNANPAGINRVDVWGNRTAGKPFVGYQIADWSAPADLLTSNLQQDIASQGGVVAPSNPDDPSSWLLLRQEWDYFPHVNTAALQNGFYYSMAALQGSHNTYYVGGSLSFETVEHSARFAQSLVKAHFPPAFLP